MKHPYVPARSRRRLAKPDAPPATSTSRTPYRSNGGRREVDQQLLDRAIAPLMEHFDTVQIVVTRLANDGTMLAARGRGNWYARVGSVRDWLVSEDENTRHGVRHGEGRDDDEGDAAAT